MNGKMKVLVTLALIVGISAIALSIVPTLAYQNGSIEQDHLRDCNRNYERDCEHLCTQNQNQTCQNVNCMHNRHDYEFRNEECAQHMNTWQRGMPVVGMMTRN